MFLSIYKQLTSLSQVLINVLKYINKYINEAIIVLLTAISIL